MDAKVINGLYQKYFFLQEDFNEDTDEVIYYDIDEQIMYAYAKDGAENWKQVFALTNCATRWAEVIAPEDENVVAGFMRQLDEGREIVGMLCRFLNGNSLEWCSVRLFLVADRSENGKRLALGIRRRLPLKVDKDVSVQHEKLDSLTLTYTKKEWVRMLENTLESYKNQEGILCMIDFNQFRSINDKIGCRESDELLVEFVKLLREELKNDALIGRLGADVFGVYVKNVTGGDSWVLKIQRVLSRVRRKYADTEYADYISLSAGAAFYPKDARNFEELQDKAKEAWVYSKLSKMNELEMYREGLLSTVFEKYLGKDWSRSSAFDNLTGLYCIDDFKDKVKKTLDKNKRKQYVLVCSDISNFKYVNATFGYDVGDRILQNWAAMLRKDIPDVVFAARECDDRFLSLREMDVDLTEVELLFQLDLWKEKVEQTMKNLFKGSNFTLNTGAYCLNMEEEDISAAIACANMARKRARNRSTGCELFTDKMRQEANEATAMVASLDEAIAQEEFTVYLQPKISCGNEKVVGAEALVRWMRNGEQLVYPDKFINTFERYGCIVKVDYFVYERVFRLLREWLDQGNPIIPISLNVSRVHFRNTDLIDKVEALMQQYDIPPSAIEFEITESMYREALPCLDTIMSYFHTRGFKVSMDDFGADGSCLNALSTIPVDVVKMDKLFMKHGSLEERDKILIKNVIHMANELQKVVLCEGVETQEQRDYITSVGCDIWQGYLCSKPIPVDEFERFMKNNEIQALG